jgi:uncharacterized membrane protein YgcG
VPGLNRGWPALGARGSASAIIALALLLALPTSAAARSFTIERFAVALDVLPDATLAVQENLTIRFQGHHNGVFRLIPVREVRQGIELDLRIDDVHVLDDTHTSLRTEVTYPGRYVKIKAWVPGAADATKTIHVLYRVRRALRTFHDHDELYWNVTGDEWEVPITHAEATVTLPPGLADSPTRTLAFTGIRGATGKNYEEERRPGTITFRTRRPLQPREGLTIVVGWPPGAVAHPSALRRAWWTVADNWPLALPLLTLIGMGLVWRAYGRDPASNRSIKPEYQPPTGLTPAEAGTLIDEKAERSDVIATLVDLGVRGYITVEQEPGGDFCFRRARPLAGDPSLSPVEVIVLQKVFGEGLSLTQRHLSELHRDADYVFAPVRDAIYRLMVAQRLFPRSPFWVRQGWGAFGVILIFAGGALFIALDRIGGLGWPLPTGVIASGLIVLGIGRAMPQRTWRGVRLLVQLRGFQEFLERAEKDRLERLPPDTLHRWLPWAIALGVSQQWIQRFQGLNVDAPAWYRGSKPFSLSDYEHDVHRFGHGVGDALNAARRGGGGDGGGGSDSGFSGGSSGGGSGGGGGGTF